MDLIGSFDHQTLIVLSHVSVYRQSHCHGEAQSALACLHRDIWSRSCPCKICNPLILTVSVFGRAKARVSQMKSTNCFKHAEHPSTRVLSLVARFLAGELYPSTQKGQSSRCRLPTPVMQPPVHRKKKVAGAIFHSSSTICTQVTPSPLAKTKISSCAIPQLIKRTEKFTGVDALRGRLAPKGP